MSLSQLWKRNAVVAAIALFVRGGLSELELRAGDGGGKTLGSPPWWTDRRRTRWWGPPGTAGQEDPTAGTGEGGQTSSSPTATSPLPASTASRPGQRPDPAQEAAAGEDADQTMRGTRANDTPSRPWRTTPSPRAQIENLVVARAIRTAWPSSGDESVGAWRWPRRRGGITEADTARIVDIVTEVAGFTASQIKIIEVE